MGHTHPVIDADPHFKIDRTTRTITDVSSTQSVLMQGDHNSERYTFEIPRYVDGHDMSLCDLVEIHYVNTDSNKRFENKGIYIVDDLQVSETQPNDIVQFTWLISNAVTINAGPLSFLIRFSCTENGKTVYAWNTGINKDKSVSLSMYNADTIQQEQPDLIARIQEMIRGKVDSKNRTPNKFLGVDGTGAVIDKDIEYSEIKNPPAIPDVAAKITEHEKSVTSHSDIRKDVTTLKEDLTKLTLGKHTDGLIYIFMNGKPVGNGVMMGGSTSGYSITYRLDEGVQLSNKVFFIDKEAPFATNVGTTGTQYVIDNVIVKMGGNIISGAYQNGMIKIPSVTNNVDIDITVVFHANIVTDVTDFVVNEGGTKAFQVKLDAQPTKSQTVHLVSTSEIKVEPQMLTFTNSNWDIYQTVTITGLANGAIGDLNGKVTLSSSNVKDLYVMVTVKDSSSITWHTLSSDEITGLAAQGKQFIRSYNSAQENILIPNTINSKPVLLDSFYSAVPNQNIDQGGNTSNITFEDNSTVEGTLSVFGQNLKGIYNIPPKLKKLIIGGDTNKKCPNFKFLDLTKATGLEELKVSHTGITSLPDISKCTTLTNLSGAFMDNQNIEDDLSNYVIPPSVNNIKQAFRRTKVCGKLIIDRNYTTDNCNAAVLDTNCSGGIIKDKKFNILIPWDNRLSPMSEINKVKSLTMECYSDSAMWKTLRQMYAESHIEKFDYSIMKWDVVSIDGFTTRNICMYGDSQFRPWGNVGGQLLEKMADDVWIWNEAVSGMTTARYKPLFDKMYKHFGDISVFWLITNDTGISETETIANLKSMISKLTTDKYIILGCWHFQYETQSLKHDAMKREFNEHFFDIHQYTLDNWQRITGLMPTPEDTQAVQEGKIPPALYDKGSLHENEIGGKVIAEAIKDKLMELNYIDSTWFKTSV